MAKTPTLNADVIARAVQVAVQHALKQTMGLTDAHKGDSKRPKPGTICAAIWDELDNQHDVHHIPKLGDIMAAAQKKGWNPATTKTQYAAWKKFNGIPSQRYN